MQTYRLVYRTRPTSACEFQFDTNCAHIRFTDAPGVKIVPIAIAHHQYATMLVSRQWVRDPVETALEAIATLNYSAMVQWLIEHDPAYTPSPYPDNDLLWVASVAAGAPFAPSDARRRTLRHIRVYAITGDKAAKLAQAVL